MPWNHDANSDCRGCDPGSTDVPPRPTDDPEAPFERSAGLLHDIVIERNRIGNMGLAGIGSYGFFQDEEQGAIFIERLSILGNLVTRCLRRELAPLRDGLFGSGFGAIALSVVEDCRIYDNVLVENGQRGDDPLSGIFILYGVGVDCSRNQVHDNGAPPSANQDPKRGLRGGIVVALALEPGAAMLANTGRLGGGGLGTAALRIHDNSVVSPAGPAVATTAIGPVSVVGNRLTTLGLLPRAQSEIGATVMILDLGAAPELQGASFGFSGMTFGASALQTNVRLSLTLPLALGRRGQVLFTDNQVSLDLGERSGQASPWLDQATFVKNAGPYLDFASVVIMSLDDVAIQNNQIEVRSRDGWLFTDVLTFGTTLRLCGNRLSEDPGSVFLSGLAMGFLAIVMENIASHCILAFAAVLRKVANIEISQMSQLCGDVVKGEVGFFKYTGEEYEAIKSQG